MDDKNLLLILSNVRLFFSAVHTGGVLRQEVVAQKILECKIAVRTKIIVSKIFVSKIFVSQMFVSKIFVSKIQCCEIYKIFNSCCVQMRKSDVIQV